MVLMGENKGCEAVALAEEESRAGRPRKLRGYSGG
jgi:hypothetical protein